MPQPTQHAAPRARLTLALLALLSALAFMDRQILAVLLVPVKAEFSLSDLQVGLVTGLGFALAFGAIALPLGRLADRRERRTLVALCRGIGGALVATRVGIGAADAGGQPCSVSTIADLYPRDKRAGAVAVFYVGVPLGMLLGFMAGGFIAAQYGWRTGFYVAAVPGVVLTLALLLFTREPRRGAADVGAHDALPPSLGATLRFMRGQSSLMLIMAASVLVTASSSAMMSWIGSLLVRSHGLTLQQVGLVTALCMGGVGALGTLAAGALADRLGALDMRWQPRLMAMGAALIALFGCAVSLLPSIVATAVALALFAACVAGLNGPTYALTQSLVAVRMRGLSMSTLVVLLNLIGVGVGPTMAGILSDIFAARYGADSVRWAMVCVLLLNLPAVWLFARAAHSIREDLV